MKKVLFTAAIAMFVVAMAGVAGAAGNIVVTGGNFNATINVIANCSISTAASALAFNDYDPTSATATVESAPGSVGVKCTKGTAYRTYITGTQAFSYGTPLNTLNFTVTSDAAHVTPYPTTYAAASDFTSLSNATRTIQYFGTITAGQDVSAATAVTAPLVFTVEY